MELRQLRYLVDVVDEGSFTKAAAKAHVAQPGVSAQIKRLEHELRVTLLDRSSTPVLPTPEGLALLPHARAALAAVADLRSGAAELTGLARGRLTIGAVASISSLAVDVPDLLAQFHHDHPGVAITLLEAGTGHLLEALRARQLDLAFIGLGPKSPEGFVTKVLVEEALVAAASTPLPARDGEVSLAALRDHPLICLPQGTGLRACLDDAWSRLKISPLVALEAGDPRTLARLAAKGLGVAIVPAPVVEAQSAGLYIAQLVSPPMRGRIGLTTRPGEPSAVTASFIQHVLAALGLVARPGVAVTPQ